VRLIFSRNRPAQLDLLLRSIDIHVPAARTAVIWTGNSDYGRGYKTVMAEHPQVTWVHDPFNDALRGILYGTRDETVTFFCDDDIVYRRTMSDDEIANLLDERDDTLCVSLRLGSENANMPLPEDWCPWWNWVALERHDFGFPASVDGHAFRVSDVLEMIGEDEIPNPTMLETVMAMRVEQLFAERRPLMCSYYKQRLVGVPVNRVSRSSGVVNGERFPQPAEELNRRFLAGERICLEKLDFTEVAGCHHEIPFVWETRP